jgi:hypothetical protein
MCLLSLRSPGFGGHPSGYTLLSCISQWWAESWLQAFWNFMECAAQPLNPGNLIIFVLSVLATWHKYSRATWCNSAALPRCDSGTGPRGPPGPCYSLVVVDVPGHSWSMTSWVPKFLLQQMPWLWVYHSISVASRCFCSETGTMAFQSHESCHKFASCKPWSLDTIQWHDFA